MSEFLAAGAFAIWLGVITSISPCPLATNITAISFVSKGISSTWRVFLAGVLYTLGRSIAYTVVAVLAVKCLISVSEMSANIQRYMNQLLGPILIVAGMVICGLISFRMPGGGVSQKFQKRIESLGLLGALLLGVIFAMAFCPLSAVLFFGTLIPLAVKFDSAFLLPICYGVATALPVFVFAVLIAFGAKRIAGAFSRVSAVEKWLRYVTGAVFIIVGIYYCLMYIFLV